MNNILTEYFRCANAPAELSVADCSLQKPGYFSFGPSITCYGRTCSVDPKSYNGHFPDLLPYVHMNGSRIELPFDPAEVVDNLRYERYLSSSANGRARWTKKTIHNAYYSVRPLLPVSIRKYLQRVYLRGWQQLSFPGWPVDTSVDDLVKKLLSVSLHSQKKSLPFIWFWPERATACTIITHDVETETGVSFCSQLMDINQQFTIPASFQIVPEKRYHVSREYLESIRQREFEVNVQDLNHDGNLFKDRKTFEKRAARINAYAMEYDAKGFRSAVLYRNQAWYESLKFEYDMSVPNVAHLDPQRGGCCTVMPYFVGRILELPVTMTQDYSLFHVLNDYSLALWRQQIDTILKHNGLISFIIHPDYLMNQRAQNTYQELLRLLAELRRDKSVWIALPREVSQWWRQRSQMHIVKRCGHWQIEGPGSERACLALATCADGQLAYRLCGSQLPSED
jgi:hypothetical protein